MSDYTPPPALLTAEQKQRIDEAYGPGGDLDGDESPGSGVFVIDETSDEGYCLTEFDAGTAADAAFIVAAANYVRSLLAGRAQDCVCDHPDPHDDHHTTEGWCPGQPPQTPEDWARSLGFAPGDRVVVYGAARHEVGEVIGGCGPSLLRERSSLLIRFDDSREESRDPRIVVRVTDAHGAWHVVDTNGRIVAGGPAISEARAREIATEFTAARDQPFTAQLGLPERR